MSNLMNEQDQDCGLIHVLQLIENPLLSMNLITIHYWNWWIAIWNYLIQWIINPMIFIKKSTNITFSQISCIFSPIFIMIEVNVTPEIAHFIWIKCMCQRSSGTIEWEKISMIARTECNNYISIWMKHLLKSKSRIFRPYWKCIFHTFIHFGFANFWWPIWNA